MKSNALFTFFSKMTICFALLSLHSCQKEVSQNSDGLSNIKTQEASTKVNQWLESQKATANDHKASVLEAVKNNLAFDAMRFEKLNDSENLIIVPIKSAFQSEVNKDKALINNLLLIENSAGKIRKGNIVEFISKHDPDLKALPANTFHKFYNEENIAVDGRFVFLNMNDKLLY